MVDLTDTASRIALARDNLTEKLGELRRREVHVRTVLSPIRHLANPWLRVGVAVLVGYRLGRPAAIRAAAATMPAPSETLIRAIVRASLVAVTQAVVRRIVVELADRAVDTSSAGPAATHGEPLA